MTLPSWDSLPIRTKRSRKRLYGVIANEYSLTAWKALPHNVKRSKKHLYNYIASAKNLEEYDELAKNNMRSTRLLYNYIKENASGSKPTLTIKVKDGESNVSGATVTIGATDKTTNGSGECTFSLDYDNYTVEVEKTGFEDYSENIKFRANHKTFTIPLEATLCKVTVTAKDGSDNALNNATVNIKQSSTTVATGKTGTDGKVELTGVRFGTYTLEAESSDKSLSYSGTLTVDGDETETITLTAPAGDTGTVTVTATVDDGETQYPVYEGCMVCLATAPVDWTDPDYTTFVALAQTFDETGTATLTTQDQSRDIPFGTYYLCAEDGETGAQYSGSLTVDGDETVTITLIPTDGGD